MDVKILLLCLLYLVSLCHGDIASFCRQGIPDEKGGTVLVIYFSYICRTLSMEILYPNKKQSRKHPSPFLLLPPDSVMGQSETWIYFILIAPLSSKLKIQTTNNNYKNIISEMYNINCLTPRDI